MTLLDVIKADVGLSPIHLATIVVFCLAILYIGLVRRPAFPARSPKIIRGNWPIVGSLGFWRKRYDWWIEAGEQAETKNFSFHVGKHRLVGTFSEEGRKTFFNHRQLGFTEGYAVLFGQSPSYDETGSDEELHLTNDHFHRRIAALLKTEKLVKVLPTLIADVSSGLQELAVTSPDETDPFDSIYKLVYRLTLRIVGATEIAESPHLSDQTLHLFGQIEQTARPYQIIWPWLPSPALFTRYWAGAKMYMIFSKILNARKKTEQKLDDPLQFLVNQGDDIRQIISFIVGALFAGQLNSGYNAAWILCYLATYPRWLNQVRKEVSVVADKHIPGSDTLVQKLSKLPLEVWEHGFPTIELCLRESIRLQLHGSGFRKNISGKDVIIDDEVVPPGGFLVYHFGHHLRNQEIYQDPEKWEPERYLPDRAEDKKSPNAYVGWGTGRHPCLGMRFAKLEQNIIAAFFCAIFDFELFDSTGAKMVNPPEPQVNAWSACGPEMSVKLRYKPRNKE
ncbi:cytochrome P450 [Microthyrium microscopicum]|uniref:Cytochrome P450 n=1 Tax=Microthyrium microscopicum TaxID=703497 RepID=A0A6A6TU82_9PEZI|nr:cytochrome P450 [Microthyrium microscopicum]